MRLAVCAGPATTGKTAVLRQIVRRLRDAQTNVAFLKIDVQYADEDEAFAKEFGIPARKLYSGELCPDHCNVMVLGDAIDLGHDRDVCQREHRPDLERQVHAAGGLEHDDAQAVVDVGRAAQAEPGSLDQQDAGTAAMRPKQSVSQHHHVAVVRAELA